MCKRISPHEMTRIVSCGGRKSMVAKNRVSNYVKRDILLTRQALLLSNRSRFGIFTVDLFLSPTVIFMSGVLHVHTNYNVTERRAMKPRGELIHFYEKCI